MVTVQLLGGMGNQMFQYALGRHLALLNGTELKLDTSILLNWSPGKHAVNRGFDLDIFQLEPHFASRKETLAYHADGASVPQKILYRLKKQFTGDLRTTEPFFHYHSDILKLKGDIYLAAGTWQSYRYFEEIAGTIKQDFSFKLPLTAHAETMHEKIKQRISVCLNVRRTDYLTVANTAEAMANVPIDYYSRALKAMQEMVGAFEVFVFSDDMDWCKANFGFIEQPVHFVDHSYADKKFNNYLQLMKACNHYIIPNSTFAWWAAWLNSRADKRVIAPLQWFNDPSVNTNDLIPPSWKRL